MKIRRIENLRYDVHQSDLSVADRTVADIDLRHLRHNYRVLREAARPAELMAVVKADAYGHGAVQVVRALVDEGASQFAVATLPEALELRSAGITARILVFGPPQPDELPLFERYGLGVSVTSSSVADSIVREARQGRSMCVHAKVDTGMHRLGMSVDEAPDHIDRLMKTPGVDVAAVWTHFATAQERNDEFAIDQLNRMRGVLQTLSGRPRCVHAANSAAILSLPESLSFDLPTMARPGIALYGLMENEDDIRRLDLKPVMTLRSRIEHLQILEPDESVSYGRTWMADRRTLIATVGVGYADGYRRALSNTGEVAVSGRRARVVGRVCMDLLMLDLGPPEQAENLGFVGQEVILFGDGGPSATEIAQRMASIPHEICCSVSPRVPRRYIDGTSTKVA